MQAGDPRADPRLVDLVELAGLWLAAGEWPALVWTLRQVVEELAQRFPDEESLRERFDRLLTLSQRAERGEVSADEVRRGYRRATLG